MGHQFLAADSISAQVTSILSLQNEGEKRRTGQDAAREIQRQRYLTTTSQEHILVPKGIQHLQLQLL